MAERFLIVCEDNKSAPNYFEAMRKHFSLSATCIKVAGSGGKSQPIQVVERAVDLKERATEPDSGTEPFDHVWCVIDGDYGDKINNARAKAKANKVALAISTPCFEYWILLHFEESATPAAKCEVVVHLLKKRHLPKYEKGTYDFEPIVPRVADARARAERLRKPGIKRGDPPEKQNPCSEVYELVNAILGTRA